MDKVLLVVVGVLLFAGSASAQTHPCNEPRPTSQTIQTGAPHVDQICARPSDNPQGFIRIINGQPSDLLPLVMVLQPNAQGLALYECQCDVQFPKGTYQYQVRTYNVNVFTGETQLSEPSLPFVLAVVDDNPPPTAPIVKGLRRK